MAATVSTPAPSLSAGELDENSANVSEHVDEEFTNFEDILRQDWSILERDSVPLAGRNSEVDGPIDPYMLDDMLVDPVDGTEQPKRSLRPQQSTKRFRDPCYDLDNSGDYDPAEQERLSRQRLKRNRAKKRVTRFSDSDELCADEAATEEHHSCHTDRQCSQDAGKSCIVFRVNSEQGKRRLEELLSLSANSADPDVKGYALRRRAPGDVATHDTPKGPAKDFIKLRARYPALEEQLETADVPVKALPSSLNRIKKSHNRNRRRKVPGDCLECSTESRRCQYQLDDTGQYDSAGCISCHDNGLPCTIREKLPSALVNDSPQTDMPAKISTSEADLTDSNCYWYPTYFNCDDAEHSANVRDCLFCTSPEAAIYGFGLRQTHIEDHQDSRRCEEVSRRMRPTSICTICTTARMNVLLCEEHDMRPIVGVYKQTGAACYEEVDVHHVEDLKGICAICPLQAVYECASEKSSTEDGNGCGLRLCEPCALKVEMEHDGNLRHTLSSLPSKVGEMLQLRADCELLRDDGALQRYIQWLSIGSLATNKSF
ncbi:hypothetical protein CKM354_000370400 [Cercospora kikuchii]|uniref:Uncharacterized protein n=1 Tax=Cercospora kikuchii TaxID=84275 RepID=A0A9P3CKX3_9PEZI|nr:uncharacterized protein CKM354_000370400 [Cercospora kikuchii]GIZ40363.1 hypothetical protein CKM354_000370400 [Cercospora kikuchii]